MKLQPNFSWQKYEAKPEDRIEQFQYQLQSEHIAVANAINSDVDDSSFWLRERQTAYTWVDSKPIYTKTLATVAWTGVGTVNTIPTGITGDFTVIEMFGCISDGALSSSSTVSLPHLDTAAAANEISILRNGTNIVLTSGGTNYSAWSGYVTIYYIKS